MRRAMIVVALEVASLLPVATDAAAQSAERRISPIEVMQIPPNMVIHRPIDQSPITNPSGASAQPLGAPGQWATDTDYPTSALREGHSGRAFFTVQVSSNGRVTKCVVTGSSGFADLDETTCTLIQRRARFRPASGNDGNAVDGEYSSSVMWHIPDTPYQIGAYPPGYYLTH